MYVNSGVMSIIVLPTDLEITVPLSSADFLLKFECKRHTIKQFVLEQLSFHIRIY